MIPIGNLIYLFSLIFVHIVLNAQRTKNNFICVRVFISFTVLSMDFNMSFQFLLLLSEIELNRIANKGLFSFSFPSILFIAFL